MTLQTFLKEKGKLSGNHMAKIADYYEADHDHGDKKPKGYTQDTINRGPSMGQIMYPQVELSL